MTRKTKNHLTSEYAENEQSGHAQFRQLTTYVNVEAVAFLSHGVYDVSNVVPFQKNKNVQFGRILEYKRFAIDCLT